MRPLPLVLIAIGLLLGPGYFLYARYLTGTAVGSYPLGVAAPFQPVALALRPEMSPVRLILRLSAEHGPSYTGTPAPAPRNRYRAVVTRAGEVIAQADFTLVSNTIESSFQEFGEVLATFEVAAAAEYRVALESAAEPQMRVTAASLEVRRNVQDPDLRVVWAGVALLGVALVGLVLAR